MPAKLTKDQGIESFLSRVDYAAPDQCWNFKGARDGHGYGNIKLEGRNVKASRLMFELCFGPFDRRLQVLHRCDNPSCVNPRHLWLGTRSDNMRDAHAKGRRSHVGKLNPNWRHGRRCS